ncbi:hypothetical protein IMG5_185190 [Ichthyophthirius multifiliis]|uniref:Uncharacterized protein n=1 Tax=Ichthyophthirius multifiliis TaxID=5932 RepID=G0R3F7_ICHMU|nr:hypothetical protein IMG5_185190 [Ichthyophthirius multifiliis]EGR27995.1 hypothetical protein IMG5_185190 [Ichthyophthirius multifiliis]|eukprot:XP_004027340.1 hypothetical protein IMG5_185190 [Ichthyophthirius multifiliis]
MLNVHKQYEQNKQKLNMKTKSSTQQMNQTLEFDLRRPIPDKLLKRTTGFIDLGRQQSRQIYIFINSYIFIKRGALLINQKNNPHESQFETIRYSKYFSKIKNIPSFNIKASLGREDNKIYENKEFAPDYNPNYEFGKKTLGSCGPSFHKIPARKTFEKKTITYNENFYNLNDYKNKSIIFKNTTCPDFKRMLPRERDLKSPLPSFMQQFVNSRTQLTCLSHKMLKQNNYFEGRFQSTESQFKAFKKPQPKEQDSDDSMEYNQE